jgi:hypothetical protein
MTKRVRIENADMSAYKVVVQVWDRFNDQADKLVTEYILNPTEITGSGMIPDLYIHAGRYLIIKEA